MENFDIFLVPKKSSIYLNLYHFPKTGFDKITDCQALQNQFLQEDIDSTQLFVRVTLTSSKFIGLRVLNNLEVLFSRSQQEAASE